MLWNELSVMIPQKGWIGKGESPKFGLNLKILSFCIVEGGGSADASLLMGRTCVRTPTSKRIRNYAHSQIALPLPSEKRKGEKVAEWFS